MKPDEYSNRLILLSLFFNTRSYLFCSFRVHKRENFSIEELLGCTSHWLQWYPCDSLTNISWQSKESGDASLSCVSVASFSMWCNWMWRDSMRCNLNVVQLHERNASEILSDALVCFSRVLLQGSALNRGHIDSRSLQPFIAVMLLSRCTFRGTLNMNTHRMHNILCTKYQIQNTSYRI